MEVALKHKTHNIWFYFEAGLCHVIPLGTHNTTGKWRPTSSEWRWRIWDVKSRVSCYCLCSVLGKYFMFASFCVLWVTSFISLWATHQHNCVCVYVCECVEGCFVLLADSSPPRVGPGRCRGVTMLINCLRSPVCVAACLPCRRVLGGFRVAGSQWKELEGGSRKGEGKGETTEGRCAGDCARVNDATLSTRRLQPCLSEQQCRRVEHDSQLAGAWRGPVLLRRFLQLTELLCAEGKEEQTGGSFWEIFFFFLLFFK